MQFRGLIMIIHKLFAVLIAVVFLSACTTTGTSDNSTSATVTKKRVQKSSEPANYDLSKAGVGVIADVF